MITRFHITTSDRNQFAASPHPFVRIDDGNYRGCVDVGDDSDEGYPTPADFEAILDASETVVAYSCHTIEAQ